MGDELSLRNVLADVCDVDELLHGSFLDDNTFGRENENLDDDDEIVRHDDDEIVRALQRFPDSVQVKSEILTEFDLEEARCIGRKVKRESSSSPMSFDSHMEDSEEELSCMNPPRIALSSDLAFLQNPSASSSRYMKVTTQPPLEVRTRTKNENRTFSCAIQILEHPSHGCSSACVKLCYATETDTEINTMGGTLTKPIVNGQVLFDDLSVSVASPKHAEKEFVLKVVLNSKNSLGEDGVVYSTPFYAYSHKSVLRRRREVVLRASSHPTIRLRDTHTMHVVGTPFVRSDRLQCVLRVPRSELEDTTFEKICHSQPEADHKENWVSIRADCLDFFSESVLFFQTPQVLKHSSKNMRGFLQVTNDGRNFSNPIPIHFISDGGPPSPKRACVIRSRM
mmetsp:Transcript_7488/g.12024  ORF Transcript_7488/g.12024 Transcript_7488/m.12024 type:complete len:395 (+) Transcript_7488:317-1501(+)